MPKSNKYDKKASEDLAEVYHNRFQATYFWVYS